MLPGIYLPVPREARPSELRSDLAGGSACPTLSIYPDSISHSPDTALGLVTYCAFAVQPSAVRVAGFPNAATYRQ